MNLGALLVLAAISLQAQIGQTPAPAAGHAPGDSNGQTQAPGGNAAPGNAAQGGEQSQEQEQNANGGDDERVSVPLTLDMNGATLDFSQEASRRNYLQGGMSVSASYDSNVLSSSAPTTGGFTYSFLPNLRLQIGRKRLAWELSYAGGYVVNQKFSAADQFFHNALFDLSYRLSPHVTLTVNDRFSRIPQLENQLPGAATTSGVGAIPQPNQTAVVDALALNQQNTATGQLTYQYSASDIVGVGVTSYLTLFEVPTSQVNTLLDSHSTEINGFYNHRLTPRNWAGLSYSLTRLSVSPGPETFESHSFLVLYTIYLNSRMQAAFFAGPEYSTLHTDIITTVDTPPTVSVTATPFTDQHWSATGGGSFSWRTDRTSLNASASRKISDGGGLVGVVELISGSLGVRRQISRFSTLEVTVLYGDNSSLDQGTTNFTKFDSITGNLMWTQELGLGFSLQAGFARQYQKEQMQSAPAVDINHNRGWFTIGYNFGKALGR